MSIQFNIVFVILLSSIIGIVFSNLEYFEVEAKKFSGLKSKNSSKSFKPKKSNYKPKKNDFKPKKSNYKPKKNDFKPKKSNYKPKKNDFKPNKPIKQKELKKIKPNSISQGSSLSSFKPDNSKRLDKEAIKNLDKEAIKNLDKEAIKNLDKEAIKNLDKEAIKNLDKEAIKNLDKNRIGKLNKITTLPYSPECGKQGNCIDIGGRNNIEIGDIGNIGDIDIGDIDIGDEINIDWDNGWDDIDWDDIDWEDIDIDVDYDDDYHDHYDDDHDHDHDDDDVIYINDDNNDEEGDTYIYNYGYPETYNGQGYQTENYQQTELTGYNETLTEPESSVQSYVTSEIKRIVNDGTFKAVLVEQGKPLIPINNSGYVLIGNQPPSELTLANGSNGQIIILTGSNDLHQVKLSNAKNIDLDQTNLTLGKDDALVLIYLDDSKSWVQVASKIV